MSVVVRKAKTDDIKTIQEIAKETWKLTYAFLPEGQMEFMLNWMYSDDSLNEQMKNGHQFFLAENENEVLGFASVSKENENLCKLNKIYVLPKAQKTGVGKALFNEIIQFAKNNKATELQLQVNRNNSAKDFYLKFGFTILYEADFEIGNGYFMNDYVMSLVLE